MEVSLLIRVAMLWGALVVPRVRAESEEEEEESQPEATTKAADGVEMGTAGIVVS